MLLWYTFTQSFSMILVFKFCFRRSPVVPCLFGSFSQPPDEEPGDNGTEYGEIERHLLFCSGVPADHFALVKIKQYHLHAIVDEVPGDGQPEVSCYQEYRADHES